MSGGVRLKELGKIKLKSLDKIREALARRPEELEKARQGGAKVAGYFCSNIPEEIILALGLIPVRLCRGGDVRLVEVGSRYVSTKNCVFIRESLGLFAEGTDPYLKNSDMIAVAATCMQMYRLGELIEEYFNHKPFILGIPRNFYLPEGKEYFRYELENFATRLEKASGKQLKPEALKESIELYRDIRDTISRIYKFQALDFEPIRWRDVFETIQAGFYLDRFQYRSLLKELLLELEDLKDECVSAVRDERPRILLSGTIIAPGDTKLVDIIEKLGGRVVADDLCSGLRPLTHVNVKDYSIAGIADAYMDRIPCGSLPYLLSLDTDRRLANISDLIETYKVEGIIYHTLRFCDPFTFKAVETKKFFKDKVAFLEIHTEYAPADVEAVRTRVEAFMELIQNLRMAKVT